MKPEITLETLLKYYNISGEGVVYSKPRPHTSGGVRKFFIDKMGYKRVDLWVEGFRYQKTIHRLIAEIYIPNPENKPCVNHRNGIKTDNRIENLEWCSQSENVQHGYDIGLSKAAAQGRTGYNSYQGKEVYQFDLNGKFIQSFGSFKDAARQTKVCDASIRSCISGKFKQGGGFIWKLPIQVSKEAGL